jgi:hypothetical protein
VSSRSENGAGPVLGQAGEGGAYSVDAPGGVGVQVGEGNTQIIYSYNRLTWTDGVAPPPLVSVSGVIDSPIAGWPRLSLRPLSTYRSGASPPRNST